LAQRLARLPAALPDTSSGKRKSSSKIRMDMAVSKLKWRDSV
jgi:hypothetical protein